MTSIIITENQSIATFGEISPVCEILERSAQSGINIDMIAQLPSVSAQIELGFTFADDALPAFLKIVKEQKKSVSSGNVKVTVKSDKMVSETGFAAKVFAALRVLDCAPLLITTGIDEISLLVHESYRNSLKKSLQAAFS